MFPISRVLCSVDFSLNEISISCKSENKNSLVCFSRYPLPCRVDIIHSKFSFNQKATTPFCIEQFFIIILSQIVINDVNSMHINLFFWIFFLPFRFVRSYFSFQMSFRFKATTSAFQFQSENRTCRREVNTNFI